MYHSILVGQDASEQSAKALEMAIWIARVTNARLMLVHLHGRKLTRRASSSSEAIEALLGERAATCQNRGVRASHRVVTGWTREVLLREAQWYDLVVVGKRGLSHARHGRTLGSLPAMLLAASPVPVLVVDDVPELPRRLLVAFDETPDGCKALRIASTLALERGLDLHVVEVVRSARTPDKLARAREYLDATPELTVDVERLVGRPAATMTRYVSDHDIHLTFLPALDRSISGHRLTTELAARTASSLLVPEGRIPPVY